jgi:hypothetical protein
MRTGNAMTTNRFNFLIFLGGFAVILAGGTLGGAQARHLERDEAEIIAAQSDAMAWAAGVRDRAARDERSHRPLPASKLSEQLTHGRL